MALTALDAALLLMILIWGSNFSLVKATMHDFPEVAFNAGRMLISSLVFLVAIKIAGPRPALSRNDWGRLIVLGIVGTFLYQYCFVGGVRRTSVGNSSLIVGTSPVVIAILSAMAGHERIGYRRWLGVFMALAGLYLVVGHRADWTRQSLVGDALMIGGMLCWATYSVAAQPILKRHSPLVVTGLSFSIGGGLYVLSATPALLTIDWTAISLSSWLLMTASATLALNLSYLIWYTGLKKLGGTWTSMYSYLTPVVAMAVAALWLGEPVSGTQLVGAGAILSGLLVTRFVN